MTEFRRRGVLAVVAGGVVVLVVLGIAFLPRVAQKPSPQAEPVAEAMPSVTPPGPVDEPVVSAEPSGVAAEPLAPGKAEPPEPPELHGVPGTATDYPPRA